MSFGTLRATSSVLGGRLSGVDSEWQGVSVDTRTLNAGELFFALRGPNFDGAGFVAAAREMGAAGAVVMSNVNDALPRITVKDTRAALGRLAAHWRRRFDVPVIGVTGSNGKTTVKQMLAACLGPNAQATKGNLNNDIGVPLMLLALDRQHDYAVFEMGANHAGEIAYLSSLVRPDVGVVTNAAPSHLEGFGSIADVAKAKGELFAALDRDCTAVINRDDRFFELWTALAEPARVLSFGSDAAADCFATDVVLGRDDSRFRLRLGGGEYAVDLPLPGAHNVVNACAAALAANAVGIEPPLIAQRLSETIAASGRLNVIALSRGISMIDDTYNANPESMLAAAASACATGGETWMAVGDMGELGADAARLHRVLGADLRQAGVSRLYATGGLSRETAAGFGRPLRYYDSKDALTRALLDELNSAAGAGVCVLVKGSRATRMDEVVVAVVAALGEDA